MIGAVWKERITREMLPYGEAYAHHRRGMVPESWCASDEPEDIQRFYETSFYGRSLPPIAESVVVFEVQVIRVSSRFGKIISKQ